MTKGRKALLGTAVALALVAGIAVAMILRGRVPHQSYRAGPSSSFIVRDSTAQYDYSLGFLEFDDQGYFWAGDRQLDSLTTYIRTVGAQNGVVLVLFAHGWNHNASPADNNVACFREVLEAAARLQRANHAADPGKARAVVGVYLGWRGLVFQPVWVNQAMTFWNRIEVADRIGSRGHLLQALLTFRDLQDSLAPGRSRLVVAGPSRGARALFSALHPFYKQKTFLVDRKEQPTSGYRWDMGENFGDLVVLVNPAFSASEYRSIDQVAQRAADADSVMDPRLLIVSSRADDATIKHYPRAQRFQTLWQSFQLPEHRDELMKTVGNHEPFITHRLVVDSGAIPPLTRKAASAAACPYLEAESLNVVRGLSRAASPAEVFEYRKIRHYDGSGSSGPGKFVYSTALVDRDGATSRRGPFMNVQADADIIPNHNEIFTDAFVDFLIRVINANGRGEQQKSR